MYLTAYSRRDAEFAEKNFFYSLPALRLCETELNEIPVINLYFSNIYTNFVLKTYSDFGFSLKVRYNAPFTAVIFADFLCSRMNSMSQGARMAAWPYINFKQNLK